MRPFFASALVLLCLGFCETGYSSPESLRNLASGRKALIYPNPNYPECSEAEDAIQLTDGLIGEGRLWGQKTTVGWIAYRGRILIDLDKVEPIDRVTVHTVGGGLAGVFYPREIQVYVSDDNKDFRLAGSLQPSVGQEDGTEVKNHTFSLDHLNTRGRYVMIILTPNGTMVFTDEVEIFRGDFDPSTVRFSEPVVSREELVAAAYGMTANTYLRGHFPESPHTPWATPLHRPFKGIILNFSEFMRDAAEIAQRVDFDYVPVSHWSYYLHSPPDPFQLASREKIEQALPTSDLMIVGPFRWDAMPPDLLEKIKARVREGMGLICVVKEGTDAGADNWIAPIQSLFKEAPIKKFPSYLERIAYSSIPGYRPPQGDFFQLAQYGAGRVALVKPATFTRDALGIFPTFNLQDYVDETNGPLEYYFAAFSKLMLWAAGKDTERITDLQATPEKAKVQIAPGKEPTVLKVQIRNSRFEATVIGEQNVPSEGGSFEFAMPALAHGRVPVEAQLTDSRGGIIDFASASWENVRNNQIQNVSTKPLYAPAQPIDFTVKVEGELSDLTLTLTLSDTEGRQVADVVKIPVTEAETKVSIPYPHPLMLAGKIAVELRKGDELVDSRLQRIWVDVPPRDDFTFIGWYALNQQPSANFAMRLLRSLGVDHYVALAQKSRAENGAYGNVRFGPEELAPLHPPAESHTTLELINCPNNPDYRKKVDGILSNFARETRSYGVVEWSIGDEERFGDKDYCICPYCLMSFREYLKGQYGSLEKLNESWESQFSKWEEVAPSPLEKIDPAKSIARWLDHRRFMESTFANYHRHSRAVVNKEVPKARFGLSGSQEPTSRNGYDWWKLMNAIEHLSGYGGIQIALQRSFLQPNSFFTSFLGYDYTDEDEQAARGRPWEVLFGGANGINYYTLIYHTLDCPLIRPDLSMTRKGAWFFEEVRELKSGLGKLFMSAKHQNDGIAIHYSPASLHSATATGLAGLHDRKRDFQINLINLCKILSESHLSYDFVHEDQMAKGALSRYKVLFLPWSSAISPTEAKAIRQFVEEGGTVIADSYCGLRDDHGKMHHSLDDLFGIRQGSSLPALLERRMKFNEDSPVNIENLIVTTGVKDLELAGAVAQASVGGNPAFLVHRVGKGQAIFLNSNFSHYAIQFSGGVGGETQLGSEASQDVRAPIREFVTALAQKADVTAPVTIRSKTHSPSEISVSQYKIGDSRLLGFSRKLGQGAIVPDDAMLCTIHLDAPRHVYESRKGRYVGYTAEFEDSFVRGIPKVYALLPYKVEGLTLTGLHEAIPEAAARITAKVQSDSPAEGHVINFTVEGPDGELRPLYAQNILTKGGEAVLEIPFAYNDPVGKWTVIAKDAATGKSEQFILTLQKKEIASHP